METFSLKGCPKAPRRAMPSTSPLVPFAKARPFPGRAGRRGCLRNGLANRTRGCGTHSLSQPRAPPTRPLASKRQAEGGGEGGRVWPPVISRGARIPARGLSGSSPVCPGRGASRALWWIMRNPPLGLRPPVEQGHGWCGAQRRCSGPMGTPRPGLRGLFLRAVSWRFESSLRPCR